ncbi:hypothetical protein [Teredinibacter sp. KSP-S5-2]|uniref:esterase/lipase family protein n=1 Tax=Teredinibacter sp. KSP-S5-2 TaxID=3034506 RepID=UPI002934D298|nr:hypothetical protein [Teredinibacter sp. KSP-S5-2]WNO08643.1 hypothetical protein P5V12_16860 [Teredinibacter sp. KSP-S5-2]
MLGLRINIRYSLLLLVWILVQSCSNLNAPEQQAEVASLDNARFLPEPDSVVEVDQVSSCVNPDQGKLMLKSGDPLVLIVHGCHASAGRFKALAEVFAFHGQQAVCFNYDDRVSLEESASQLYRAVESLSKSLNSPKVSILGHSQGGLISRRAFTNELGTGDLATNVSLTTVSAPFNGISASSHCGSKTLAWLSLGLTQPLCYMITGAKYKQIPPNSDFIRHPGKLIDQVSTHLRIATDEKESCREYKSGVCVKDDYVFSLNEQFQTRVDQHQNLVPVTVKAGHVEIVGDANTTPDKLIAVLQQNQILRDTPEARQNALTELLNKLYLTSTDSVSASKKLISSIE